MSSFDLKVRAINLCNTMSIRQVGQLLSIGRSTVCRWIAQSKCNMLQNVNNYAGRVSKITSETVNKLVNYVVTTKLVTLMKVKTWVKLAHGITTSIASLSRLLRQNQVSYKHVKRQVVKSNSMALQTQFKTIVNSLNYSDIVCLDEVGFQLAMSPNMGWSKVGEKCRVHYKSGGYKRYHGIFLITSTGRVIYKIENVPINTEIFSNFINSISSSEFKDKAIVLDNLRVHHNRQVVSSLRSKFSNIIWTPPYSPDLNPIEMVFSSLKSYLRVQQVSDKSSLIKAIDCYFSNSLDFNKYYNHSWC